MKAKQPSQIAISLLVALALILGAVPMVTMQVSAAALSAPPENLQVPPMAYDEAKIVIMWDKPADYYANGQNPASGYIADYEVYIDDELDGTARDNFAETYVYLNTYVESFYTGVSDDHYQIDIHSYTATGLEPDTEYTFKVRAVYDDGSYSPFSEELTHSTAPVPEVVDAADHGAQYITSTSGNYTVKGANSDATVIAEIEENTKAIQAAIDATPYGGKVVLRGSGDNASPYYYVSGALFLHGNMTIEIEEGAVLFGSPVFDHYPRSLLVYPYSQDIRTYGLLNAVTWDTGTLENIRIVGKGAIDGNGWKAASTNPQTRTTLDPNPDTSPADPTGNNWRLRNYFAGSNSTVSANGILAGDAMDKSRLDATPNAGTSQFYNTRPNLTVARGVKGLYYEGLTFYNPAFHGIVNYHSEGVVANGVIGMTFNTNNGDGIEFGDCHDLYVMNTFWDTGDDAINFASGQGTTVRNLTDKVACGEGVVFNNYVRNGHGGLLAIGSHVGGTMGDLLAEDNLYNTCESGSNGALRMKAGATTGGGIRNIVFRDNALHYTTNGSNTIVVDTSYSDSNSSTAFGPESEHPLTYQNINVRNLTISNLTQNLMTVSAPGTSGLSKTPVLKEFHLEDINVISGSGGAVSVNSLTDSSFKNINKNVTASNTKNITIENCGTSTNQYPTDLSWGEGAALVVNVNGNKVDISSPALSNATSYVLLVDMLDGHGYQQKGSYSTNNISVELAPTTDYKIAVRPETSNAYGELLEADITTGAGTPTASTITMPSSTSLNASGASGISWQSLLWSQASDSVHGIQYYELTAVPASGETKTFKAYFDRTARTGYSLWGLDEGVSYTVSMQAVNWVGEKSAAYGSYSFTTVPGTLLQIPEWDEDSELTVEGGQSYGEDITISWNEDDVTEYSNGDTDIFAGYRVMINGVVVQPENGNADPANATPTVEPSTTSYTFSTANLKPNTRYVVSVEAGNEILKYASGSGGLSGSTGFTGTNSSTADLPRNQVTFGKWTGHGPSIELYYEAAVLNDGDELEIAMDPGDTLQLAVVDTTVTPVAIAATETEDVMEDEAVENTTEKLYISADAELEVTSGEEDTETDEDVEESTEEEEEVTEPETEPEAEPEETESSEPSAAGEEATAETESTETEAEVTAAVLSAATANGLTWTTSNEDVATVSEYGLVTAVADGEAVITVTSENGFKAMVKVTVGEPDEPYVEVESINLNAGSLNMLSIGKTLELDPTILPENATDKTVTYTSNNPNVASVDEDGVVTAHKTGTALITATASSGKVSKTTVRVTY